MDVSAVKKQSPFAALTDQAAQPTATDEFLNVFRKHLSGGANAAAAANGLSDPSKALFAVDQEQAEIALPEPERPQAKPEAAKGPERPRDRQQAEGRTEDEAEAPAEETAAPQQTAAKPARSSPKGKKADENADAQAAPVTEDKVVTDETAAIVMLVAPTQVADQVNQAEGPAMVQTAEAEAIVAPQAVAGQGQQAAKPVEKAPQFTPAAEIAQDAVEAQPAQVAAAAAAPAAQRRKIEFETGAQEWLEEPIQVTMEGNTELPAAQGPHANAKAQDLIVAMTAGQEDPAQDFALNPQFVQTAAPTETSQPTASSATATANDAALAADTLADAATAAPVMPVMATSAADAGPANAAAKPAVEAPTQVSSASATQAASGTDKAKAPAAPPPARAVPPKELVPEIKAQIVKAVADGVDRINIKMRPEQLGKIEIRLEVGQDGRLTAMFTAENKDTLQMLQRDARDLHKAFQEAGLSTDSNSLTFNLSGRQGDQQEAGGQPKGGRAKAGDIEAEIAEKAAPERRSGRSRGVDISV